MKKRNSKIKSLISESENILILSHKNPDGDNIGSIIALGLSLRSQNYNVTLANLDPVPSDYLFLEGASEFNLLSKLELNDFDLIIALDCSDLERVGDNRILEFSGEIINIDHHKTNSSFGDINIVDTDACATGEIVYGVLRDLGFPIDRKIANALYTAISTDSGSFKYSSVTAKTHRIIADLIENGINVGEINIKLYQNRSLERAKLFIEAYNTIKFYEENRIGMMIVTKEMMSETNTENEDTEGLINFIRDIDTVEIAILLREVSPTIYKASFRSKGTVDVSELAALFGGGGHKQASGATINMVLNDAQKSLIDEGRKALDD